MTAPTSRARSPTSGSARSWSTGGTRSSRPDWSSDKKPPGYTEPVEVEGEDVAPESEIGGSIWGRIFPFLLVIMALTGAFYPAVDLCAGEKERGTMETLLISPASRSEIVLGKFFTVMLASILTALLNLVSMGVTGLKLAGQLTTMGLGDRGQDVDDDRPAVDDLVFLDDAPA